jgi:hypothetical protein
MMGNVGEGVRLTKGIQESLLEEDFQSFLKMRVVGVWCIVLRNSLLGNSFLSFLLTTEMLMRDL